MTFRNKQTNKQNDAKASGYLGKLALFINGEGIQTAQGNGDFTL